MVMFCIELYQIILYIMRKFLLEKSNGGESRLETSMKGRSASPKV
jgi:hypothetical protein